MSRFEPGRLIVRDVRGHALDMEAMAFTNHYASERVFGMYAQSGKLRHAGQLLVRGHSQRVVAKRSGLARATVRKLAGKLLAAKPGLSCACGRAFIHRGICVARSLVTSYPKVAAYRARPRKPKRTRLRVWRALPSALARERRILRIRKASARYYRTHRETVCAKMRARAHATYHARKSA